MKNTSPARLIASSLVSLVVCCLLSWAAFAQAGDCGATPDSSALDLITAIIKNNPDDANAYFERAKLYSKLSRYDEALKDLKSALSIDPELAGAYVERGFICQMRGNYGRSIKEISKGIAINPNDGIAFGLRARAYDYLKNYDLAEQDYTSSLTFDDQDPSDYYALARMAEKRRNPDLAAKNYGLGLQVASSLISSPNSKTCRSDIFLTRGLIYSAMSKLAEAESDLKMAKQLSRSYDVSSRYYLGFFYLKKRKEYQLAVDEFSEAIKIDSNYAESYRARSEAYALLGQKEKAEADRKKFDELGSEKEPTLPGVR